MNVFIRAIAIVRIFSFGDHIELTYHDVTVFDIPEFKSLEVLEKRYFCINIIVNQPQN